MFDPGIAIEPVGEPLGFRYSQGVAGPRPELRGLDSLRRSLRDPNCNGPDPVYAIAMDVYKDEHRRALERRMLLYGVVTYACGRLGEEPIRSQGHMHKVSAHCGWSTPEVYEIWSGSAVIYLQESAEDHPGRCFAVYAGEGDVVIVPPYWVHATISADPYRPLTFGAWCDRDYGFVYDGVRRHRGIAWFPLLGADSALRWEHNPAYVHAPLLEKKPEEYRNLGLKKGVPIYTQFEENHDTFMFVSEPARKENIWRDFLP
jgi:glucose-6-phosphate isomerase